jgi:hypothetical protein
MTGARFFALASVLTLVFAIWTGRMPLPHVARTAPPAASTTVPEQKEPPDRATALATAPKPAAPAAPAAATDAVPGGPVEIEMKNVHLHADNDIILDVAYLRGEMITRTPGQPPVFDDPNSYVLRVGEASVSMDLASLEHLLNERIFSGPKSPLTDIHVKIADDGRLQQSAKLHKGPVTMPVSMKASVSAAPDGRLKIHVETEKALGIPTTGLLSLFGLEVDDLVRLKDQRGVEIAGNDIFITPGLVVPPAELSGKLASVTIKDGRLVQTFVRDPSAATPLKRPTSAPNYVYFSGSVLRFGKLTMTGADLQIVDATPGTPFDFFPGEYAKQLVAGYSRSTANGGLIAYMPDYADAARGKRISVGK